MTADTLHFQEVSVAGFRARVWRAGVAEPGADLPVLALHGWGAGIEALLPAVTGLAEQTAVIVPDQLGHGGSHALPDEGFSAQDFAAWTAALLDELEIERAHVLGHSHGARVAICLAAERPERVGRLLLCSAAGLRPRRPPSWYVKVGTAKAGRVAGAVGGSAGRALQERMRTRIASQDWLEASESSRATLRKLFAQDLSPELERIAAPTLLVWGAEDRETPLYMAERMEQLIPDCGLVVFPGAGHFVYADDVARFRRVAATFLIEQPRTVAARG